MIDPDEITNERAALVFLIATQVANLVMILGFFIFVYLVARTVGMT